jgi:hypothetical protein
MKSYFSRSLLLLSLLVFSLNIQAKTNKHELARAALSNNNDESAAAIAELRDSGPAGLSALFQVYGNEINRQITSSTTSAESERLNAALDAVSQQKDSYLSRLYWYTDLAQAKAAARSSGKPILSLRLLGNLNEEFSCANSRFFRSVLYANAEVSDVLRENFVLHWQSVRPAPRVTIDFGDGRRLETTITGNSIHYVLDPDGQALDALPGLYGPKSFLRALARAQEIHGVVKEMDLATRALALDDYHRASIRLLTTEWIKAAKNAGGKIPEYLLPRVNTDGTPRAVEIAPLALTKMSTELTILRAITRDVEALGRVTDEATWTKIALQHIGDARLDNRSIGLIRRQTHKLLEAKGSSSLTADMKLTNLVQKLQLNIALDSVRNEYMLHTKLHAWLAADPNRFDIEKLNEKVYAELFLTPKSDPWLGLFSPDTYLALQASGIE